MNINILKVIGDNIRIARTQKGFTQSKLAELLNTSDKFISYSLTYAYLLPLCIT